jgi:chorismate mutase
MDKIKKVIDNELDSLTLEEKESILDELREEIDEYDKAIVELLNKRTFSAVLIGRVKKALKLPTYSPEREKDISEKINSYLEEPLTKSALQRIYERIIDEARALQKEELIRGDILKPRSDK